ncbi:dCTP deaminase [Gracilimonas sp. BCB1]|uniref:dCTP deaminase n=1 Tax=Gracilimonas sp. BCB1 TaxID=3152362 RepID=UPI0032D967DE
MSFLAFDELKKKVANLIHEDTQRHGHHLDLTVAEVHRINGAGSLDFGGSEFKPATTEKLNTEKQKTDDEYGWWKLQQGPYKIIFNESVDLEDGSAALISAHPHVRKAGLISNAYVLSDDSSTELSLNVTVSEAGCNIKENARIAELRIISD